MTVVVTFLCEDGVVIAADSMMTPDVGGVHVGHHNGKKIHQIGDSQIFAYAGDQGQAARVRSWAAELSSASEAPIDSLPYVLGLTQSAISDFRSTGLDRDQVDVNAVLAFHRNGAFQSCVFEGMLQPRLLDEDHYYAALGTGKLSADPFLRFLTDIFCQKGRPSVSQASLLATWVVNHVIETNPGGVAGPIRLAALEFCGGQVVASDLNDSVGEHSQAITSAGEALRMWRDSMQSGAAAEGASEPPSLQKTNAN